MHKHKHKQNIDPQNKHNKPSTTLVRVDHLSSSVSFNKQSEMPNTKKKATTTTTTRTNKKKNRGRAKRNRKNAECLGYFPPFQELIDHFSVIDGVLCRDGKEVLSVERLYDKAMEMIETLQEQKREQGLEDCNCYLDELKEAMDAKYHFGDLDLLNLLVPDADLDEGDSEDRVNAPQRPGPKYDT